MVLQLGDDHYSCVMVLQLGDDHYSCLEDYGYRGRNKIHHAQIASHKTHRSSVVIKTYKCHIWGGGINHNGNFTNVIFPTQQELSPIYGQFFGHVGEGVPVTNKFNLYLCLKKGLICNCHGHIFFFKLKHIHGPPQIKFLP